FAVAVIQGGGKGLYVFELSAARVILPILAHGPEVLFGNHAPQAFNWGRGWSHAGFGIESPCSAEILVLRPVAGRDVLIGAGHLHAAHPRELSDFAGGGREIWIRPAATVEHTDVHLFDRRRRRVVAAIQPHQQAGVAPQTFNLVAL